MWEWGLFAGALTPKLYVALTGTSSLISGLILIFEWWYFRKYGTSFIEQVTAGGEGEGEGGGGDSSEEAEDGAVCRNPQALLRGAEYARLWAAARAAPLTYHDMNLTAQDHQAWFGVPGDGPVEEALARAWREREPRARVAAARDALRLAPACAPALLLLAEEDAPTVAEAERVARSAWRAAEAALRAGGGGAAARARDAAVLAHAKRRAAMCLRRRGRLRDAARLFRALARAAPPALAPLAPHENLLEVLLERRAYGECSAALARCAEAGAPRSACLLYTAALLAVVRGAPAAHHALRRAVRYNPRVPPYLLELVPLRPPPEHVLRRGESEALAYAFCHLRHWRAAPGALPLLAGAWRAWGGATGSPPAADAELVAGTARRGAARALLLLAALCGAAALTALVALRWPSPALSPAP